MANGKTGRYDRDHLGAIRRIRLCISLAVLLLLTFSFVLGLAAAGDAAMEPDYGKGRPVVFLRLASEYKRGDVVVLRLDDGKTVLRRVIAVAGDTVDLRGGQGRAELPGAAAPGGVFRAGRPAGDLHGLACPGAADQEGHPGQGFGIKKEPRERFFFYPFSHTA